MSRLGIVRMHMNEVAIFKFEHFLLEFQVSLSPRYSHGQRDILMDNGKHHYHKLLCNLLLLGLLCFNGRIFCIPTCALLSYLWGSLLSAYFVREEEVVCGLFVNNGFKVAQAFNCYLCFLYDIDDFVTWFISVCETCRLILVNVNFWYKTNQWNSHFQYFLYCL